jgi:F420H(2)-dependent biliverdin reductase
VAIHPADLSRAALEFMSERHLATLTTLRADGSPHVVPVGFTWDADALVARVISGRSSAKVIQARAGRRAALSQVQARRWITLEGTTRVIEDAASVREAEERYAVRYRVPRPNPERVVVVLDVDRVLGGTWPIPLPPSPYAT